LARERFARSKKTPGRGLFFKSMGDTRVPAKKPKESLLKDLMNTDQRDRHDKRPTIGAEDLYDRLIDTWNKFVHEKGEKSALDLMEKRLKPQVSEFIKALKSDKGIMQKVLFGEEPEMYLPCHSVNVAALAVKVALEMGYSDDELNRLALTALMHDVGMQDMPSQIWRKKGALSSSEVGEIRKHPLIGYELLKQVDEVAQVVLQEHERMDGTGYPQGIVGRDIHEFAYIIGIADIYNSLTHIRPYREKRHTSFEAIQEIVKKEKQKFPASVLKSLFGHFLFPAGTRVVLNGGEKAEVVEENRSSPMRPVVKITHDKNDREYDKPRIVDLDRDQTFFIISGL
jgi:HD-GYP domain-containing protein (c-di-GMP phosphodiesterase class II)